MSDFFGDLSSGIRLPGTQINQSGPLPGTPYASYDGRINANGALLSGVTPYGGAKGLPMGSDKNYQQVPHRSQQIIPPLYLPHADALEPSRIKVSHAVDQGDVAFILNSNRIQNLVVASDTPGPKVHAPGRNAFCNIATVNYILAGLQRLNGNERIRSSNWAQLAEDFEFKPNRGRHKEMHHARDEVLRLLATKIMPFGICAGSEKQGGLHETGLAPVQAAVNHVTTMTVDGQNRDLVNYWRAVGLSRGGRGGIQAGDQLIFRLEWMPTKHYTLNHYYKGTVTQVYPSKQWVWQLVPDKFEMCAEVNEDFVKFQAKHPNVYDYRCDGYWRIGQSFQHRNAHDSAVDYNNDLSFMRGQLLQVTFAPAWVQMDSNSREAKHIVHASDTASAVSSDTSVKKRKAGSFAWDSDDDDDSSAVHVSMETSMPSSAALGRGVLGSASTVTSTVTSTTAPTVPSTAPSTAPSTVPSTAPSTAPAADLATMASSSALPATPVKTGTRAPAQKQARFTAIRTTVTEEAQPDDANPFLVDLPVETASERKVVKVTKKVAK